MELLLINKDDFKPYRNLSVKVENEQLAPYILEAQSIDLYGYLGPVLYGKVMAVLTQYEANKTAYVPTETQAEYVPTEEEQNYLYLLNGRDYTSNTGLKVNYRGLKAVLVYLTYSRYIREAHIFSTQSGFKINNNQYSEHVSTRDINEMATRAENDAQALMRRVWDYTKEYSTAFDYNVSSVCGDTNRQNDPRRLRLGAVRGRGYSCRKEKGCGCDGRLNTVAPTSNSGSTNLNATILTSNDFDNTVQINLLNNL